jgi:CRP/FNR family transcriptional regulator, cyclic AMP receptor protein
MDSMDAGALGKFLHDGEIIVRQGDVGECMYVIQTGRVEVFKEQNGEEVPLGTLEAGDFFGEMALVDRAVRSATVRAIGETRLLSVDKRTFLRRVHEDPALALRIVEKMSRRIRDLHKELVRLQAKD